MAADKTSHLECVVHGADGTPEFPSTQVVVIVVIAMTLATVLVALGRPEADVLQMFGGMAVISVLFRAGTPDLVVSALRP
jgi:hypothetical protein